MKKFLSTFLAVVMIFPFVIPVFATEYKTSNSQDITFGDSELSLAQKYNSMKNISVELKTNAGLIQHEIKFPTIVQLSETNSSDDLDSLVEVQGQENIQVIKSYINELNLSNQEKEAYIKHIDTVSTDGYVDSYTIYTPSANSSGHTFYGLYYGMAFYQRNGADISINYKRETESNVTTLNKWVHSAMDLVLLMEEFSSISVAVTAFNIGQRMLDSNYSARSGDYSEFYVRSVSRMREIGIIDDWGDFRTVLVDYKVDLYPYSIYYFSDPSIMNASAAVTDHISQKRTMYTDHYLDGQYILQAAYEQYTQKPDIILYMDGVSISENMFEWMWKERS